DPRLTPPLYDNAAPDAKDHSKMEKIRPKLTIGMATSEDSYGVWQTITDLRLDHAEAMRDVEILVIDDAPCTKGTACENPHCHSSAVQRYLGWCRSGVKA